MNLNPEAYKILCYGDSNTWGRIPEKKGFRYPVGKRWTSLLQRLLGKDYWVIEEGLGDRTTDLEDPDKPGRNGLSYLLPCVISQNPIDLVIVMLGTNDFKQAFAREAEDISAAMERVLNVIVDQAHDKSGKLSKIILMSPPIVDESVLSTQEKYKGAEAKSKELGALYRKLADDVGCEFIDVALHIQPSKVDGYHLDESEQIKIAEVLYKKILDLSKGKILFDGCPIY